MRYSWNFQYFRSLIDTKCLSQERTNFLTHVNFFLEITFFGNLLLKMLSLSLLNLRFQNYL